MTVSALCRRCVASLANCRNYHYKPKDSHFYKQVPENFVNKDSILFRYEEPMAVFRKNLFAMTMLPLWTYLGYFAYSLRGSLKPYKETVDKSDRKWVMDNIERASLGVGLGFFLFGTGLSGYWLARTMNTVRRLVLRKGGKHITIVTYGLFGANSRYTTVPVSHCSAVHQAFYGKERFFLRVRDHAMKYQFNLEEGIFSNRPLFDRTVGISRKI